MFIAFAAGVFLVAVFTVVMVKTILSLRRVVPTNEVHIIQSGKSTTSYGKDTGHGNTYYLWPSWIPVIGVTRSLFPTSVFDIDLKGYEAYDSGRLPFVVNVKGFFRIDDSNMAAQRVANFDELKDQLMAILQGAARVTLASHDIEEIMTIRSKLGDVFTAEVAEQLKNWGVTTVKNIELMDIHDHKDSRVIQNIMAKKQSHIEMESRTEVAKNKKAAQIAEINATREVEVQQQDAKQQVGLRTIETEQKVELQRQAKEQLVSEQAKLSMDKQMDVVQVERLRSAEIEKKAKVVEAEQNRETSVIQAEAAKNTSVLRAEGTKQEQILLAQAQLEATKNLAEGISAKGAAEATAAKLLQLAPVEAQIVLAKEIGENQSYQQYLITLRQVEANQAIGVEQAKSLEHATIKIIATAGSAPDGIRSVGELFSAQGGTKLAAAVEALSHSETGKKLVDAITGDNSQTE